MNSTGISPFKNKEMIGLDTSVVNNNTLGASVTSAFDTFDSVKSTLDAAYSWQDGISGLGNTYTN